MWTYIFPNSARAPDAKLTGNACVGYNWAQGGDNIYICANSLNNGKYNYNNLAAYYATWYRNFGQSNGTWRGRHGIST